ncbi:hypothetical protein [Chelatococcus reniformis]|uniref:hypothetical protein n=1 Tax=Chelatococcus reniformis TaxID=1494448 RepID=UPI001AEE98CE|nr:hypothetical protein [Chelatococcus reniformis]
MFDEVEAGSISPDGSRLVIELVGPNGTAPISLPVTEISGLVNLSLRLSTAIAERHGTDPCLPVVACAIGSDRDGHVTLAFGLEGEAEITVKIHQDSAKEIADTILDILERRALAERLRAANLP